MLRAINLCRRDINSFTWCRVLVSLFLSCILGLVTVDRVWIGWMDLLATCVHHSKLHFTGYWHTQTSVLSLVQSKLAASSEGDSSTSHAQVLFSQPPVQNSCLLISQLTGSYAGGHFTPTSFSSLNWTGDNFNWTAYNSNQQLTSCFKLSCL
jgi:hypothetical protein